MITLAAIAALLASFALTGLARRYALRRRLIDEPNSRSSHRLPTVRGGGIGFVVTFEVALAVLFAAGVVPLDTWLALLGAGVAVAGIGFLDDHRHVPAKIRFLVHALAAVWVIVWLEPSAERAVGSGNWPAGLAAVVTVLFVVWLINLYNFMDGIDGLAGVEAVTAGLGAAWLGLLLATRQQHLVAAAAVRRLRRRFPRLEPAPGSHLHGRRRQRFPRGVPGHIRARSVGRRAPPVLGLDDPARRIRRGCHVHAGADAWLEAARSTRPIARMRTSTRLVGSGIAP